MSRQIYKYTKTNKKIYIYIYTHKYVISIYTLAVVELYVYNGYIIGGFFNFSTSGYIYIIYRHPLYSLNTFICVYVYIYIHHESLIVYAYVYI